MAIEVPVINVRMSDILAERARSGEMRLRLAYEEGMRAGDVVTREGFRGEEAQAILTMVNGEQRPHSQPLDDGDTVELVIPMVGGAARDVRASARRHRCASDR